MSFQGDAPIIQKVSDFYRELCSAVEKMPKKDKYTIGEKTGKATLELLESLISAGSSGREKKLAFLDQANTKLELLKILVRLSEEIKAVPAKKYLFLEEKLVEVGKMLGGWMRSLH